MNPTGVVLLGALTCTILFASRRSALIAVLAGVLFLTLGQWVTVAEFHIYPIRLLLLAAFIRVCVRTEWSFASLTAVDAMLIATYAYRTVVFIAGSNGSATLGMGVMVDILLAYFAFRGLLQSLDDLVWVLCALLYLLVPYAGLLWIEVTTGQNPFVALGGIAEVVIRNSRPRAIGSFQHASLLGTFGASIVPLYIGLALTGRRLAGFLGIVLGLTIVYFSNSGGPLSCVVVAMTGWMLWGLRTHMRAVRTSIVAGLVLFGLFMQAPIWYLPARVSSLSGGDGWHRSYLVDIAFQHFDEWWLSGMPVVATRAWFPYTVSGGGADMLNYYLDFGITAGVMAAALFCSLLTCAYLRLGRGLKDAGARAGADGHDEERFLWALGVVLSLHVFNWFAICYFDQYQVVFLMQLAAISSMTARRVDPTPAPAAPVKTDIKRSSPLRYATRRLLR